MTVTVYKSTDTSAPSLTGQAGSLITLLDAILVNGYGSKTSQGWTKPFTGTNAASYRVGGGNQRYLDVADNAAGSAAYARIVGYESMSALATGTNPFPTAAQFSGGLYCHKSATADATARPWFAYGNNLMFYLFVATDSSATNPILGGFMFGDFTSYVAGDTYNTLLFAGTTTSAAVTSTNNHWMLVNLSFAQNAMVGCYLARANTGLGGSVAGSKHSNGGMFGITGNSLSIPYAPGGTLQPTNGTTVATPPAYPMAADSSLYMERFWILESGTFRGEMPGLWCPMHSAPLAHLDTFSGAGSLASKSFEALRCNVTSSGAEFFVETSSTW